MKNNMAARLMQRRKELGLTQQQLANKSGISRMGIAKVELGSTQSTRADTLYAIARALHCDPLWLLEGLGTPDLNEKAPKSFLASLAVEQRVPELTWEQASSWSEGNDNSSKNDLIFHPCPVKCSPGTYALVVDIEAMKPRFDVGDIIFVDPTLTDAIDGKFVVISTKNNPKATFKQVQSIDSHVMLKSLNPDFPSDIRYTKLDENSQVIGTLISHVKQV